MEYRYINTDYLESVSGGDNSVIVEIIDMFREQAVEMYNEMEKLLSMGSYHHLGLLAHKAKSSVAIMGMADLASMLKTFELEAKDGRNTENYEGYVRRFRDDTNEAIKELDDLIITKKL